MIDLKVYDMNTCPFTGRAVTPAITVSPKGRIGFNKVVLKLLKEQAPGHKNGIMVSFFQDKVLTADWYLSALYDNGYPIRILKSGAGQISNPVLAESIRNSIYRDEYSENTRGSVTGLRTTVTIPVSTTPESIQGKKLLVLETRRAKI